MIEFICVSNRPANVEKLAASIKPAIGDLSPWNLTVVDGDKFDIFTGFNHGAKTTRGDLLAFVHDDVQFLGNPISMAAPLQSVRNEQVGFVGIAGSKVLDSTACWWGANAVEALMNCRGIVAHQYAGDYGLHFNVWPPGSGLFGHVLVLDGTLLMCHRRTFDLLDGFDEKNYKGFHFYDIDITFRATQERLVNVAAPILVLHESGGNPDAAWETGRQVFLRKFGHLLPARVG